MKLNNITILYIPTYLLLMCTHSIISTSDKFKDRLISLVITSDYNFCVKNNTKNKMFI